MSEEALHTACAISHELHMQASIAFSQLPLEQLSSGLAQLADMVFRGTTGCVAIKDV